MVTPSRGAGGPKPVHTCPPASPQRRGTHTPAGTLQPVSRASCVLFRRGRASRSTGGARAWRWGRAARRGRAPLVAGEGRGDTRGVWAVVELEMARATTTQRGGRHVSCVPVTCHRLAGLRSHPLPTPKALVEMGCHPRCSGKLRKGPRPPLGASVGEGEGARAVS